jgi:hypothetical protein
VLTNARGRAILTSVMIIIPDSRDGRYEGKDVTYGRAEA